MNKKFAEQFQQAFQGIDLEGMQKAGDDLLKKAAPLFDKIKSEQQKLAVPKSKKNTKWDGKAISISLIEDGRVLINFQSLEDAETFYKNFEALKSNWLTKLLRKCRLM